MNRFKNAALTPRGRAVLISRVRQHAWTVAAAAEAAGVNRRTAYKWFARFDAEGLAGLQNRSSKPHRSPAACWSAEIAEFEQRRRQRLPLWRIAQACGRSLATVACQESPNFPQSWSLKFPHPVGMRCRREA